MLKERSADNSSLEFSTTFNVKKMSKIMFILFVPDCIVCAVIYRKQRKKLHDRLRQSLRSERNNMVNLVNGPHHANPPAENVQLANVSSAGINIH